MGHIASKFHSTFFLEFSSLFCYLLGIASINDGIINKMTGGDLRGFKQFNHYNELPRKPGVYKVCLPRLFARLSGKKTRVVYIGKAGGRNGLRDRTRSFFTKSSAGRKAIERFRILRRQIGTDFLFYYRACSRAETVRDAERRELQRYKDRYWELPPLNHSE